MITSNRNIFFDKKVKDYIPSTKIDPAKFVYRLRVEQGDDYYDDEQDEEDDEKETPNANTFSGLLEAFVQDPKSARIKELIIGMWSTESDVSSQEVVDRLVALKTWFKSLKALYIGDITSEENEISWINQTDLSPLLKAYPTLEHLQIRGAEKLSLGKLKHDKLKTLIIESGGLNPTVIKQINMAQLPNLNRLELWLGTSDYGFNSKVKDFKSLLSGTRFPRLKWLGLMDSEIQDEIAIAVAQSPVLKKLKVLDLSMGTLSDKGAAALLNNTAVKKLQHLNLAHHYLSADMMKQLKKLGISINLKYKREADVDGDRYVEVSE